MIEYLHDVNYEIKEMSTNCNLSDVSRGLLNAISLLINEIIRIESTLKDE